MTQRQPLQQPVHITAINAAPDSYAECLTISLNDGMHGNWASCGLDNRDGLALRFEWSNVGSELEADWL